MSCQGFVERCSSREGGVADDELGSSKRNRWLVLFFPVENDGSFQDKPFRGHIVRQKFGWLQDISSTKTSKFYRVLPSPSIEVVATTYISRLRTLRKWGGPKRCIVNIVPTSMRWLASFYLISAKDIRRISCIWMNISHGQCMMFPATLDCV